MSLPFFYFLVVFLAALLGGIAPIYFKFVHKRLALTLSFSAGILVGASFIQLIPEAFQVLGSEAGLTILIGYLLLFLLEKFILVHPCEESHCAVHHIGLPAFFGISLHTLADGFALGASVAVPKIGFIVFLALLFHKIPSAFSLSAILMAAKYSKRQIVGLIFLFAMTIPIGGIIATYGVHHIGAKFLGWSLGLSAGTFLAISTSDIFVQVHTKDQYRFRTLSALLAGVLLSLAGKYFAPI